MSLERDVLVSMSRRRYHDDTYIDLSKKNVSIGKGVI